MVYFESFGENDFASIFPSVAEERREEEERRQTEMFLRLLDEIDHRKEEEEEEEPRRRKRKIEHFVAVNGDGDIVRTDDPVTMKGGTVDRNKVHTLDDLPKESEWDMIFGPQPEPEPPMQVSTGLRVRDGKKFYRAYVPGEPGYFQWTGVSAEMLLALAVIGIVLLLVLLRGRKVQKRVKVRQENAKQIQENFDKFIEAKVDKRVKEHMRRIKASDFK